MTCIRCGEIERIEYESREFMGEVLAVEVCADCGMPAFDDREIMTAIAYLDFEPWEFRAAAAREQMPKEKSLGRHVAELFLILGTLGLLMWSFA